VLGGVISYANAVKESLLRVPAGMLAQNGAGLGGSGRRDGRGRARRHGRDCALAITGVAGPDGGTAEKPVGLVYVSCAVADATRVARGSFPGDRATVREFAATAALHLLRKTLDA